MSPALRVASKLRIWPVAYFSAEFGLHECLPTYAGGLGILAGDHLKSASDLGVPIQGIGLLYAEGYFRQRIDKQGWQREEYTPIEIGDPERIGITDLAKPDYGDRVQIKEGEVPIFWACGVTPQAVALRSKPALMITHSPGHMFITDLSDEDFSIL